MEVNEIQKNCNEYESTINQLKSELEKSKANAGAQMRQLESEVNQLRMLLEEEGNQRSINEASVIAYKEKSNALEADLNKANERIQNLIADLEFSQNVQKDKSSQSAEIAGNMERKDKLISELKEQICSLEEKLSKAHKAKYEAIIASEEANNVKVQFQYKEQRYEQEKSFLNKQIQLLQSQLEERSREALTQRSDSSSKILKLQSDLNVTRDEIKFLREDCDAKEKTLKEKSMKIEELLETINEARKCEVDHEQAFRNELNAHQRLCSIYKESNEDQKKRIGELEKGIEELRQLLQEASDQYGALEAAKKAAEKDAQEQINKANNLIKDLKDENDKVNSVLESTTKKDEAMYEMSPAASAANHLIKKGLTLSQLYSEYMSATDRLFQVEEDNKRLNRYVNQILQEIEDKAPILTKQKEDYHRALETIETLHNQVDSHVEELQNQKKEAEDSHRRAAFLGRENEKFSRQIKDLSKQVTVLLTQIDAVRSGLPAPPESFFGDITDATCADDVINDRLLAFRDVSEMQKQNLNLLTSLRDITDKMELMEKTAGEEKTKGLQKELAKAYEELDELREGRNRLQTMVESLTQQRDLYKTMNATESSFNMSPTSISTPRGKMADQKEMERLQEQLETIKKEYEDYKSEKSVNDQLEKRERENLKSNLEAARKENVKLLSNAEYNEERMKNLKSNCETFQRQIKALEDKCNTLHGIVGKHEATIENLREHSLKINKQLSQAEASAHCLSEEKNLWKENEIRLRSEIDSLKQSSLSHSIINSNLELIKTNLERVDCEKRIKQENQITELSVQCARLKNKLESNIDLQEAKLTINKLEVSLKDSEKECSDLKNSLKEAEGSLASAKAQISEIEKNRGLRSSPVLNRSRLSPVSSPIPAQPRVGVMGQTVRELEVQLTEERAKTAQLQISADRVKAECEQYNSMCKQLEEQLNSAKEANRNAEQNICNLRKELEESKKVYNETSELLKKAEESEKACKESLNDQLKMLSGELEEKERMVEEMNKKAEELNRKEISILEELKKHERASSEVQEKYEREVMLHGADLQACTTLKEKLATCNKQLEEITSEKDKLENYLKEKESGFENKENNYKKSIEELKERTEEMNKQNENLVSQFTQLSEKLAKLQNKLSQGESAEMSFSEEETKSTDQLREVINYLRREKEIAMGKAAVAETSYERLQAQKSDLEKQLDSARTNLAEERQKNLASTVNTTQYEELLRKAQTFDALADSNKVLREERESLKTECDESKAKSDALEKKISPMLEKMRDLTKENENLQDCKTALDNEKEMFRKRSQELVEKLNKAKPEDMKRLQNELEESVKEKEAKDQEINRLKSFSTHLQKNNQTLTNNKNQIQSERDAAREESKKATDERKRLEQDKIQLRRQIVSLTDKSKSFEAQKQTTAALQKENRKLQENLEQCQLDKTEFEEKLKQSEDQIKEVEKKCDQLRKIARKYKKEANIAESKPSGEADAGDTEDEGVSLKDKLEQMRETINELQSEKASLVERLDQQASGSYESKPKEENSQLSEEEVWKARALESKIKMMEEEKKELLQQSETYQKKLSMQQKLIENMQKQAASASKASPVVLEKTTTETPPTANIKPMAAPQAAARTQTPQVSVPSRSIPTASIRPMAPSSQTSTVVMVPPRETQLSGDGAVSSTVTLPQATVTPTPAVPTSTATLSFPSALTATVSPTPVSSSIAMSGYPQQPQHSGIGTTQSLVEPEEQRIQDEEPQEDRAVASGSNEAILHEDESDSSEDVKEQPASSSQKRKLDVILEEEEEEEEEDNKRARHEDDSREPSSSSNLKKHQSEELIVVPSDDDEMVQQSDDHEGLIISNVRGGSEAELRIMEEDSQGVIEHGHVQSSAPQSVSEEPSSSRHFSQQQFDDNSQDRLVPSTPTIQSQSGDTDFVSGVSQSSDSVGQSIEMGHIADDGIIDAESVPMEEHAVPDNVSSDGNISSSAGECPRAEPDTLPSGSEQPVYAVGTPAKHDEPDSGLEESESLDTQEEQDEIEVDQAEQTEEELRHDEDSQSSLSEDTTAASPRNLRPQTRRVPITWDNDTRGSRGRGRAAQQAARGSRYSTRDGATRGQKARRSKPSRG